ncbi:uncharacterized protein EDB91DRAFT_1086393 [Suillus paluster]|uniref:uncharacterized protein n=1 Tax=Suillus paluster TaxID=48578 RepID=UPI001B878FD8|nr:uncharacterized protein EDB91DRAFT_1086393 [Suillus paluster]KAG1727448.1 hypothetical protein EDB91DRAFT_1086393 [Suillus paluster]
MRALASEEFTTIEITWQYRMALSRSSVIMVEDFPYGAGVATDQLTISHGAIAPDISSTPEFCNGGLSTFRDAYFSHFVAISFEGVFSSRNSFITFGNSSNWFRSFSSATSPKSVPIGILLSGAMRSSLFNLGELLPDKIPYSRYREPTLASDTTLLASTSMPSILLRGLGGHTQAIAIFSLVPLASPYPRQKAIDIGLIYDPAHAFRDGSQASVLQL